MWIPQPKGKLHPLYELSKIVMFFEATKDNWQSCPKYKSFFKKIVISNFHFQCWSLSEENGIFLSESRFLFCSLLCCSFWWALLKSLQEFNNSMNKIFRSHSLYCTIYLSYYGKCAKFELKFQKSLFPTSFHSCWLWRWVLTWKSSLSTRELLKNSM